MINVKKLIKSYSLKQHLQNADDYFKDREYRYLLQKPFHSSTEAASSIQNLGSLLELADLKENYKVLDFAAGSCWLSKILVELGCEVTSCDASEVALNIGKELFEKYPPIKLDYKIPNFDNFNGEFFNYKDKTFDRIIVNDAFHHIPNTKTILKEFIRVLKDDGYVIMSEPGRYHSTAPASQYEMKHFNVIENDFVLEYIWNETEDVGFKSLEILPILRNINMDIDEYLECISGKIPNKIIKNITSYTINHSIFRLSKNLKIVNKRNEKAFEFNKYLSQVNNHFMHKIDKKKK